MFSCLTSSPFTKAIFGFFKRKTDLYHVMKSRTDNRGFPPGVAEKLVLQAFRKQVSSDTPENRNRDGNPPKICEESPSSSSKDVCKHDGFSTWNGGKTPKYSWCQTISEVTVDFRLTNRAPRKGDVKVEFTSTKLRISVSGEVVIAGDFHARIDASESTWTIEDMSRITLSLQKSEQTWWPRVLVGDEEIDTSKIESTKRIEEYDGETQGAIRKIMYDEQRKRQGLPTSDEEKLAEKLKAAWDIEGSPFKGTPFDANVARGFMN